MTQESAEGERLRFPAPEEMLAIERAVRRARAQAIARLFAAAGRQLKELIRRTHAAPRNSSQFPTKRKTMTTLFWHNALASLPPSVRPRYAASFEAAERFDALLDLGIEAWGSAKHLLAKICQAAAHAMRVTARILDGAARRLLPVH
jgi:hypothetical protein